MNGPAMGVSAELVERLATAGFADRQRSVLTKSGPMLERKLPDTLICQRPFG